MKRMIFLLALMMLPVMAFAANQKKTVSDASQLVSLISQYSGQDGFQVVKLGSVATSLVKTVIRKSIDKSDPEERALLDLVGGIRKVAIVEYEGCSSDVKSKFVSKVDRMLTEENLLMSANDGSDNVKIYGFVSEDGGVMKDFILHSPSNGALICLFGTISIDALAALAVD